MPDWSPHHDGRHRDDYWKGFEKREGEDLLKHPGERARVFDFKSKLFQVNRAISRAEIVNAPAVQLVVDRGLAQMTDHWVLCFQSRLTVRRCFTKGWTWETPATWWDHAKVSLERWALRLDQPVYRAPDLKHRFALFVFNRLKDPEWIVETHEINFDEVLSSLAIPEGQMKTCIMVYEDGKIVERRNAPTMAELDDPYRRPRG